MVQNEMFDASDRAVRMSEDGSIGVEVVTAHNLVYVHYPRSITPIAIKDIPRGSGLDRYLRGHITIDEFAQF